MIVEKGIIFEFYDGVVDAVVIVSPDGRCFAISRIADDWKMGAHYYLAHELPTGSWERCLGLLAQYMPPTWPWWSPSFALPNGEDDTEAISTFEELLHPGQSELFIFKATGLPHTDDFVLCAIPQDHLFRAKALWEQRPRAPLAECEELYRVAVSKGSGGDAGCARCPGRD